MELWTDTTCSLACIGGPTTGTMCTCTVDCYDYLVTHQRLALCMTRSGDLCLYDMLYEVLCPALHPCMWLLVMIRSAAVYGIKERAHIGLQFPARNVRCSLWFPVCNVRCSLRFPVCNVRCDLRFPVCDVRCNLRCPSCNRGCKRIRSLPACCQQLACMLKQPVSSISMVTSFVAVEWARPSGVQQHTTAV